MNIEGRIFELRPMENKTYRYGLVVLSKKHKGEPSQVILEAHKNIYKFIFEEKQLLAGDKAKFRFSIVSREYNNRVYHDIRIIAFELKERKAMQVRTAQGKVDTGTGELF